MHGTELDSIDRRAPRAALLLGALALALTTPALPTPGAAFSASSSALRSTSADTNATADAPMDGLPVAAAAELTSAVHVIGGPGAVPEVVASQFPACVTSSQRQAGGDRYATAVAVGSRTADDAPVYLASGERFPDALVAGPLIARGGGVLLLSGRDALPDATRTEITRRAPTEVVVFGGPGAVSDAVVAELRDLGPTVRRISGDGRYSTAAEVAATFDPDIATAYVVTGDGFADALAIGPVAGRDGLPVLLTAPAFLPQETADALQRLRPREIVVVGGPGAVSGAVVDHIRDLHPAAVVRRVAGTDRYATAAAVTAASFPTPTQQVFIATGSGFADALSVGPVAGAAGLPLLLAGEDLDPAIAAEVARLTGTDCRVVTIAADAVEGLTLGPSLIGGTTLRATLGEAGVVLRAPADTGAFLLPTGTGGDVHLAYPTPVGGVPAVAWIQALDGNAARFEARQPWRGERPSLGRDLTVAWQYTGDSARYRQEVDAAPGLTVTAPFRYYLNTSGELVGGADAAFIADMHARGVKVWPTIHTCGATCVKAALADPGRRADIARRIHADAKATGADGINIDIEGFHTSEAAALTDFVQQLAGLARPDGIVTSYDFTTMTDTWVTPPEEYAFWSTAPDRRAISEAVDYAVLMAYDQFNRYRPEGPVASAPWVEEGLRYQLRYSDPDRTLLGVPLYGRVWRDGKPANASMAQLEDWSARYPHTPQPQFGVDRVDLPDGRYTWAETVSGLPHRTGLVRDFGLAGTASWRLGFDTPEVWPVLTAK